MVFGRQYGPDHIAILSPPPRYPPGRPGPGTQSSLSEGDPDPEGGKLRLPVGRDPGPGWIPGVGIPIPPARQAEQMAKKGDRYSRGDLPVDPLQPLIAGPVPVGGGQLSRPGIFPPGAPGKGFQALWGDQIPHDGRRGGGKTGPDSGRGSACPGEI